MDFFSQNSPSWLVAFSTLLILSCLSYLIIFTRKRGNLPPGPPKLPIIGNLHQLGKLPHRSLSHLSKKFGPVMLLKLGHVPTIVVSTPETAKHVLKTHDLECCSRPLSYGASKLSYNLLDLAFSPYGDYWREMRKLCMIELFSMKRVKSFEHVRAQEMGSLLCSLAELPPDTPVQLSERIFCLMNSVICRISFGGSYEGRQFNTGGIEEIVDEAMAMMSSFWVSDFFPILGWVADKLNGRYSRLDKVFTELDTFFERVIEQHLDPERIKMETQEDIVDILLGLSNDENALFRLTRDHVKAMLMDIFVGAIDTSSLTVTWAMTELTKNPRVMKKVQAEIRRCCVGRKTQVDEADLDQLEYLKMVVKETFRLHPPAPLLLGRESMGHCKIGGYDVYPKTRILVNAWAIGRDQNTWDNPEEFYPERFEKSGIEIGGNNFELIPFGAGRRICPGLTMGSITVELTLANLLYCFDWQLPQGMKKEDISMEEEGGLTVHKKLPLYLVPMKYNRSN